MKHKNYAEFLAKTFDYWVIIEGASKNKDLPHGVKKCLLNITIMENLSMAL